MYNKYPYTDNNQLNLDWFLSEFKTLYDAWVDFKGDMEQAYADLVEDVDDFKEFVTDYLDNLDYAQAINDHIDELIADGTFITIIQPVISDEVGTWLADHIGPTTPAVDSSLTVAGAAADAKTVGDICFKYHGLLSTSVTDLSTVTDFGFYGIISANYAVLTDLPADLDQNAGTCLLMVYAYNANAIVQTLTQRNDTGYITVWNRAISSGVAAAWNIESGVDRFLTSPRYGADAYFTGYKISKLNESTFDIETVDWKTIGNSTYPYGWRTGYYYPGTGTATSSTHHVRSVSRMHFKENVKYIEISTDLPEVGCTVTVLDSGGNYIEQFGDYKRPVIFVPVPGYRYLFSMYRYASVNNTDIDQTFVDHFTMKVYRAATSPGGRNLILHETGNFAAGKATERISLYAPQPDGYMLYRWYHMVDNNNNTDNWQLYNLYHTNANRTIEDQLSLTAEWECAISLSGGQYAGGHTHGNEVETSIKLFVDGAETGLADIDTLTSCNEMRIVKTSTIYDPADGTTPIASHGIEYIFENDLVINQALTWAVAGTSGNCFLAMMPISKSYSDNKYDDTAYNSVALNQNNYTIALPGCRRVVLYDSVNGYRYDVGAEMTPGNLAGGGGASISDNGGLGYNKVYIKTAGSAALTVGDTWKSHAVYKIMSGDLS